MSADRPSIDHSILSPSGRCSKRARKAALERERKRLFPPGFDLKGGPTPQPSNKESLLRHASRLRDLADRGMHPRKYRKLAAQAEAEAAKLRR